MNSKCQSLFLLASLGLLSACSQQYAASASNGMLVVDGSGESISDSIGGGDSTTITERTEINEYRYGNNGSNGNNGNDGVNGGYANNGAGYNSGISSSDINTQGYAGDNAVGYNQYDADARRQQQLAAERVRQQRLAQERARQQQLAAERARQQRLAQERARQQQLAQGGNNGQYDQYSGSGGGYGASNANQNGQYGGASSQYSSADLKNPASLLSKRIIYFDFDQSSIKPQYMAILDAHANYLRSRSNLSIRLEGHADDRGSREYNLALSERRARAVRDYLSVKGIDAGRMTVVGYGEEIPVKLGENEQSWSQNRRVEIKYSGE